MGVLSGGDIKGPEPVSVESRLNEIGLFIHDLLVVKGSKLIQWNDFAEVNIDPEAYYLMELVGYDAKSVSLNHDEWGSLYDGDRPDYVVYAPQFFKAYDEGFVAVDPMKDI